MHELAARTEGIRELALFAGACGGQLASQQLLGWRTICYVENDPYCVGIIKTRIRDGLLDDAPIWDDVRTFDGRPWRGCVDCVSAGFPCQPFSVAGQQQADLDERNLWPETIRVIGEVQPRWCLLENVPGLLSARHGYFGTILGGLAESGFDARWKVLSAGEVGAPHLRKRLWIVANTQGHLRETPRDERPPAFDGSGANVAYTNGCRCGKSGDECNQSRRAKVIRPSQTISTGSAGKYLRTETARCGMGAKVCTWHVEPDVGRVADGVASRVDRLRALGNGQVPIVAATAWNLLSGGA